MTVDLSKAKAGDVAVHANGGRSKITSIENDYMACLGSHFSLDFNDVTLSYYQAGKVCDTKFDNPFDIIAIEAAPIVRSILDRKLRLKNSLAEHRKNTGT